MRKLNFKNCVLAVLSVGCLTAIALFIAAVLLFQKYYPVIKAPKENKSTHLISKEKPVKLSVGLIADTENDWDNTQKALNEIKSKNIEYVFHVGDLTQLGVSEDFQSIKKLFDNSGLKVYSVPGDRDLWKSSGVSGYEKWFGMPYQFIVINGLRFIFIDNSNEYEGIGPEEWQFIEQNVTASDFVILHNPLHVGSFALGRKGMGEYSNEVDTQRIRLLGLIRPTNVKAVFAGDQHIFSENVDEQLNDLFHYVVGSLNQERSLVPTYAILSVYEDGDYFVENINLE